MKKNRFEIPSTDPESLHHSFYDEINYGKEYDHEGASISPGDRVLDCGACIGMFTDYAYKKGASKVYSVEMKEINYACLKNNMKTLWAEDMRNIPPGKVEYPVLYNMRVTNDTQDPQTDFGLNEFLEHNYIDFVKMDIEGGEWASLLNLKNENMQSVNKWAIELHVGWSEDKEHYPQGDIISRDYKGHYATKALRVIEKFTNNGFSTGLKHVHPKYDVLMLYAWK